MHMGILHFVIDLCDQEFWPCEVSSALTHRAHCIQSQVELEIRLAFTEESIVSNT